MDGETQRCPQCGSVSPMDAETCPNCGAKLILRISGETAEPLPFIEHSDTARTSFEPSLLKEQQTKGSPIPGEAVDERFLKGYSCGTGCWIYLCNRIFWPIVIISYLLGGCVDSCSYDIRFAEEKGDYATANLYTAVAITVSLAWLSFILWLGRIARRKRWVRLKWKSFRQFAAEERMWNVIGAICWILLPIAWVLLALLEPD